MANIKIKDRLGNDMTYEGIEGIELDTPDGGKAIFSYGQVVEDVQIDLDFSGGDQVVSVPEGSLVKQATIKKPDTLVPENIAKDVEIAGVVGTSSGGGIDINGDVEQREVYYSTTISAGDFLKLSNEYTRKSLVATHAIIHVSSCKLPDGRIFICYANSSYQLCGFIATVGTEIGTNKTVSKTSPTVLDNGNAAVETISYSSVTHRDSISAVTLPDGRVFIAYKGKTYSTGSLMVALVTINEDDTLSTVTTALSKNQYAVIGGVNALALPDGRVLIVHSGNEGSNSLYYLNAKIVEIDGDAITVVGSKTLQSESYSARELHAILLSDGRVLIAHTGYAGSSSSYYYAYTTFVTIDGDTMTSSTVLLNNYGQSYDIRALELPDKKVIVIFSALSTHGCVYGLLDIADGGSTILTSYGNFKGGPTPGRAIHDLIALDDGRLYLATSSRDGGTSGDILAKCVITMSGTTAKSEYAIVTDYNYIAVWQKVELLPDGTVFVVHSGHPGSTSYKYLYGSIVNPNRCAYNKNVKAGEIYGIATGDGAGREIINVCVPNT